jgi:SAM-dependent methyltransferase
VFESRATEIELLDQPDCDPELAAASYRFMEKVNRYFGGARVVRQFLARETARLPPVSPLRILDIGSGSCDIALELERWAAQQSVPIEFTCLEIGANAAELARERLARAGTTAVRLLQEDVFAFQPAEKYDYAVASMCFHHFSDAQIIALLRKLRAFVERGVLINDLQRSRLAYEAARLLSLGAPAGLRHDVLLSVRRGFTVHELKSTLRQLDRVSVSVTPARWFRVAAAVHYQPGDAPCAQF